MSDHRSKTERSETSCWLPLGDFPEPPVGLPLHAGRFVFWRAPPLPSLATLVSLGQHAFLLEGGSNFSIYLQATAIDDAPQGWQSWQRDLDGEAKELDVFVTLLECYPQRAGRWLLQVDRVPNPIGLPQTASLLHRREHPILTRRYSERSRAESPSQEQLVQAMANVLAGEAIRNPSIELAWECARRGLAFEQWWDDTLPEGVLWLRGVRA